MERLLMTERVPTLSFVVGVIFSIYTIIIRINSNLI